MSVIEKIEDLSLPSAVELCRYLGLDAHDLKNGFLRVADEMNSRGSYTISGYDANYLNRAKDFTAYSLVLLEMAKSEDMKLEFPGNVVVNSDMAIKGATRKSLAEGAYVLVQSLHMLYPRNPKDLSQSPQLQAAVKQVENLFTCASKLVGKEDEAENYLKFLADWEKVYADLS